MTDLGYDEPLAKSRMPGVGFTPRAYPKGIQRQAFDDVVSAVQAHFVEVGAFPAIRQVANRSGRSQEVVAKVLATDEAIDLLEERGVSFDLRDGLSQQQNLVLLLLADPGDRRKVSTKLKDAGVPWATYLAWMKNPVFSEARRKLAEDNFANAVPDFVQKVVEKADDGDMAAVKLGLEMSGRFIPGQAQVQEANFVVQAIIESVISVLADQPAIRERLLAEIEARAVGFRLGATARAELEG